MNRYPYKCVEGGSNEIRSRHCWVDEPGSVKSKTWRSRRGLYEGRFACRPVRERSPRSSGFVCFSDEQFRAAFWNVATVRKYPKSRSTTRPLGRGRERAYVGPSVFEWQTILTGWSHHARRPQTPRVPPSTGRLLVARSALAAARCCCCCCFCFVAAIRNEKKKKKFKYSRSKVPALREPTNPYFI